MADLLGYVVVVIAAVRTELRGVLVVPAAQKAAKFALNHRDLRPDGILGRRSRSKLGLNLVEPDDVNV